MKFLIDTHIFIWMSGPTHLLPESMKPLLYDRKSEIYLSVVSLWEMQIKIALGKLPLHLPLSQLLEEQRAANQIQILPLELHHVLALEGLPPHHKDPFDRLLIAQAQSESWPILSVDGAFESYDLPPFAR